MIGTSRSLALCLLLTVIPLCRLCAQSSTLKNKFTWGMEVAAGTSFPNFSDDGHVWKASLYSVGSMSMFASRRLTKHFAVEGVVGYTGYSLVNKLGNARYILDFGSPYVSAGLEYHRMSTRKSASFIRLSPGLQMGYNGSSSTIESNYEVQIEGDELVIAFARADIGFRREFGCFPKENRIRIAYELSAFYRHNFNSLGTARFISDDYDITISPSGSIMGISLRMFLPLSNKQPGKQKRTPKTQRLHTPRSL